MGFLRPIQCITITNFLFRPPRLVPGMDVSLKEQKKLVGVEITRFQYD